MPIDEVGLLKTNDVEVDQSQIMIHQREIRHRHREQYPS